MTAINFHALGWDIELLDELNEELTALDLISSGIFSHLENNEWEERLQIPFIKQFSKVTELLNCARVNESQMILHSQAGGN